MSTPKVSRRTLTKGVAWSVPAVVAAAGVPAFAASGSCTGQTSFTTDPEPFVPVERCRRSGSISFDAESPASIGLTNTFGQVDGDGGAGVSGDLPVGLEFTIAVSTTLVTGWRTTWANVPDEQDPTGPGVTEDLVSPEVSVSVDPAASNDVALLSRGACYGGDTCAGARSTTDIQNSNGTQTHITQQLTFTTSAETFAFKLLRPLAAGERIESLLVATAGEITPIPGTRDSTYPSISVDWIDVSSETSTVVVPGEGNCSETTLTIVAGGSNPAVCAPLAPPPDDGSSDDDGEGDDGGEDPGLDGGGA